MNKLRRVVRFINGVPFMAILDLHLSMLGMLVAFFVIFAEKVQWIPQLFGFVLMYYAVRNLIYRIYSIMKNYKETLDKLQL